MVSFAPLFVKLKLKSTLLTFVLSLSFSHNTMRGLSSGGQKWRSSLVLPHGVVLASYVSIHHWQWAFFPSGTIILTQIIFLLDYLDRESLAALIEALKVVYSSSPTTETSPSLCKEVWAMRDLRLASKAPGHNWVEGRGRDLDFVSTRLLEKRKILLMQWVTRLTQRMRRKSVLLML